MAIAVRSSKIELLLCNHVHSFQTEMETISRTARRRRNIRVAQWSIFAIVKENSQVVLSSSETENLFSNRDARTSDITINFRQAGYRRQDVESRGAGRKKINYHFIQYRVRSYTSRSRANALLIGVRRDARTRDRKTFAYTRTSPYHFNGILNSRRRVPKLMQSQFPGSCAWYISDFPPLRYRLESSPSHAAAPDWLVLPNNRLLPNCKLVRVRVQPSSSPMSIRPKVLRGISQLAKNKHIQKNHAAIFKKYI